MNEKKKEEIIKKLISILRKDLETLSIGQLKFILDEKTGGDMNELS